MRSRHGSRRTPFEDRATAGKLLAERLEQQALERPLVLALPKGGIPIAYELAEQLSSPMDVLVVRKIGAPANPEYALGAITEDGYYSVDEEALQGAGASWDEVQAIISRRKEELTALVTKFRGNRPLPPLQGRTVIIADDGLATGATALVAARYLRKRGVGRLVLAAPVCSQDAAELLRSECDEVICLASPELFYAVGAWYRDFAPVSDEQALALLGRRASERELQFRIGTTSLQGTLNQPKNPQGLIVFAHGSGSSRRSPRNRSVARALTEHGFTTLLFDLLAEDESRDRALVFDIPFLAERLVEVTKQARALPELAELPLGFFGASTGAAAALWAAAQLGTDVNAVVSRGGRPDLAFPHLGEVTAPTLLIVGGDDKQVIDLNRDALAQIPRGELVVVPGATHLFEEPGKLEEVAELAGQWFLRYLHRMPQSAAA